jgi:hypothetical protein
MRTVVNVQAAGRLMFKHAAARCRWAVLDGHRSGVT